MQWLLRGGQLGSARSYGNIGKAYIEGDVVEKYLKKVMHLCELAAIGGEVGSRHNLGVYKYHAGNKDKAIKHFMRL